MVSVGHSGRPTAASPSSAAAAAWLCCSLYRPNVADSRSGERGRPKRRQRRKPSCIGVNGSSRVAQPCPQMRGSGVGLLYHDALSWYLPPHRRFILPTVGSASLGTLELRASTARCATYTAVPRTAAPGVAGVRAAAELGTPRDWQGPREPAGPAGLSRLCASAACSATGESTRYSTGRVVRRSATARARVLRPRAVLSGTPTAPWRTESDVPPAADLLDLTFLKAVRVPRTVVRYFAPARGAVRFS